MKIQAQGNCLWNAEALFKGTAAGRGRSVALPDHGRNAPRWNRWREFTKDPTAARIEKAGKATFRGGLPAFWASRKVYT